MSQHTWRRQLAKHAPTSLKDWVVSRQLRRLRQRNAARSAGEVFSEIYEAGQWGGGGPFNSGSGSRGEAATRYGTYVRELLRATGARTVVDIGCGDFGVAAQFVDEVDTYHGVDVVRELIARNQASFGSAHVRFSVLDPSDEEPPTADVCLIRQVLQHLSNKQIGAILRVCGSYPLVVVTEHWPADHATGTPNVDKPHGPDTRLDSGSWVDITHPPFNCAPVQEVLRVPVTVPLYEVGETIRTQIWHPPPHQLHVT